VDRRPARELPGLRESFARFGRAAVLLRPYWRSYLKLGAGAAGLALVGLVGPLLTKLLVDRVYPTHDVTLLGVVVAAILIQSLFSNLIGAVRGYYAQVVGAHVQADTTVFLVNHLQHLPLRFFEGMPVGDVLSRFGDLRAALGSVSSLFNVALFRVIYLVLIPPVLLIMSWRLTLVALATIPVTTGLSVLVARALRRRWKLVAEANADVQALNVETLSHIRTLKGLELFTLGRTMGAATGARDETVGAARLTTVLGVVTTVVRALGTAVYTYVGWSYVLGGALTLGSLLAFSAYLGLVQAPLAQFASTISQFQRTAVTLDRIFELLDEPTETDPAALFNTESVAQPLHFDGSVHVRDVRLRYPGGPFTLDIPGLDFPAGTVTGIIGESGSGKSTLLRLVAALDFPDTGEIRYGECTRKTASLTAIRSAVAVAWQTPELLRGTLRENIDLGVSEGARDRLTEVLRVCQLEGLIRSLPDGLDTYVAEWGATLSGGQQQRLSLARALMRDARVTLLDEVTSNLDPDTEDALMPALLEYLRGRTVVVVSHRPTTIKHVDRVIKMVDGRVVMDQALAGRGAGTVAGQGRA
jgi:ABC-type bacteriocin/lantibiotic exporter with double-glycine peptidase domain